MEVRDLIMLGSFILTILGTSWKLHNEISTIKNIYHEDDVSVLYDKGSEILSKHSLS